MGETLMAAFAKTYDDQALFQISQACIDVITGVPGAEFELPGVDRDTAASIGIITALLDIGASLREIKTAVENIETCSHE